MPMSPTANPTLLRHDATTARSDIVETFFFRACCAISVLVYLDCANVLSISTLGYESMVKYAYFVFIVTLYLTICLTTTRINMGLDGPAIFLVFTALSVTALAFQMVSPVQNNSYAAAFLATLLVSAAAIFDVERHHLEPERTARIVQKLLLLLSGLYIVELLIRSVSGLAYFEDVLNLTNHIKSFIFVASACLAILRRDRASLALTAVLFVVSQILRPSSSLIAALLLCGPIALAMSRGWMRTARIMTYVVVLCAAIAPIALYLSPDLKTVINDAEAWTKEDLLQGRSNTFFRLAIQDLAIDRLQDTSIAFGAMFSSANSVALGRKFGWWLQYYPTGMAAIHSDYVSILFQSGAVGYVFYNVALLMICKFLFDGIALARSQDKPYALIGLSICCMTIVIFYTSSNPFLQYYTIAHIAWFLVALGYIQVRAMRRWARRDPGRAGALPGALRASAPTA